MTHHDTIVSQATPQGYSGIAVIRMSGSIALQTAMKISKTKHPLTPMKATLLPIHDHEGFKVDGGVFIYYKAPKSYTGEDVVEIISHGNNLILNSIVNVLCDAGATRAEPGEFTQRAYMNNKLSLAEAEAVSDLISASNVQALKAAQNSLNGKFSDEV